LGLTFFEFISIMGEESGGVVSVKEHTVMARTIAYCDAKIAEPAFAKLTLVAESKAVNKCISILEILKRTHGELIPTVTLDESPATPDEPRLTVVLQRASG
jgi:hypothetical protein